MLKWEDNIENNSNKQVNRHRLRLTYRHMHGSNPICRLIQELNELLLKKVQFIVNIY